MSEPDTKLKSAANNAILQLASRWVIIGVAAIALPSATWIANRGMSTLDKVVEDQALMKIDIALIKQDLRYLRAQREHAELVP